MVTVFAIVVLYRQKPSESRTVVTLQQALLKAAGTALRVEVLLADNTPGGQADEPRPASFRYRAYPGNPGLARPYNDALGMAEVGQFQWLLTLDQDTSLPDMFLVDMAAAAGQFAAAAGVAAIVPHIVDGGRHISPFRYWGGFLPLVLPAGATGISVPHTSALNSASLVRVRALRKIGGYDEKLALHNTDTRLFQQLHGAGMRVAIAGQVTVPHQLAILNRGERMTTERYRKTLLDECDYYDRYMGFAGRVERLVRLIGRLVKGLLQREDRAFLEITLAEIFRRLTSSRTARLAGETRPSFPYSKR